MTFFRLGDTLCQIRHGPQILARSSFSNRSSCYVYHAYPAWEQGSGILHAIDGCGLHWGILRKTWRCGGNKVKDSEKWEVKQDTWDGFAPASAWHSSGLRESSDIILVLSCMPRNQEPPFQPQFNHSDNVLRACLACFAENWVSRKRNPKLNNVGIELRSVSDFLQPVLRINWMSCSWTLLIWGIEILLHAVRLGQTVLHVSPNQ